ncbi:ABC transporter substrate-binding protein [Butyrivibrio sp. AC2005]|uniref:ABC transporter substrate-binding protein n=1 Tax=Butyrivibrio sp. AC2005 TaxID=1280672 RepID=UPI00041639AB|nr:ABC transporter substrate-binding protein [Butyrivibrio sp. AC2005]
MRLKKFVALMTASSIAMSLAACGQAAKTEETPKADSVDAAADSADTQNSSEEASSEEAENGTATEDAADNSSSDVDVADNNYTSVVLGETGKDITTTIKLLTHRTDMLADDYPGTNWASYIAAFNEVYPNITVDVEGITDYAEDSLLRLQGGDWGDVMMIPGIDASEYANYFMPYGTVENMESVIRFAKDKQYDDIVYGIPSTGNAQGVLYNKAVFEQAGIDTLPTTPEEFIEDLKLIKEKTDAIPLYTNYAAGWTMGAWDAYIAGTATGDATYMNQKLPHTANPFSDPGDGTHAYNVYKVLYDAVAEGLIEDDYSTTDWEGCKGMINRGEIGTMVLGSWAYSQMQAAGDKPEDIGYMSFPIKVNGKQYASAGPDYAFGINKDASDDNRLAALVFVKWMTNESGFSYNEGGIPINAEDNNYPDLYAAFDGVEYVSDETALPGEEDLKDTLNSDSELNVNNGGDKKVQSIIEHASNGDMTFDEIMDSWNQAWTEAQELSGVEIKY